MIGQVSEEVQKLPLQAHPDKEPESKKRLILKNDQSYLENIRSVENEGRKRKNFLEVKNVNSKVKDLEE